MFASLWLVPLCLAAVVVQVSAAPSSSPGDDVAKRGAHHHHQPLQQQDAHTSGHHGSSISKRGGHHHQPVLQQDAITSGHHGSFTSKRGGHHQQPVLQQDTHTSGHNRSSPSKRGAHHQLQQDTHTSGHHGGSISKRGAICADGWKYFCGNCTCYKYFDLKLYQPSAKEYCRLRRAKLVEITSAEENEFVTQLATTDGAVWHAINDDDKEGTWTLSYSKVPVVYSNWAAGEPNNAGRVGENCAIFSGSTGLWNDLDCIAWIGFVCEKQRPCN